MNFLCWWTQAAPANAAGLLGTIILAWGAIRVIPSATRAYRVTETLGALEQLRKQRSAPAAQPLDPELAAKFDAQESDLEALLTSSLTALTAVRDRWTGYHTVLVAVGVVLSAASDLLPLLALMPACAVRAVTSG